MGEEIFRGAIVFNSGAIRQGNIKPYRVEQKDDFLKDVVEYPFENCIWVDKDASELELVARMDNR